MARIGIVGWEQEANIALAEAWRARGLSAVLLAPPQAMSELGAGDVALGRLDVLPTLDGVEPGLAALRFAAYAGARVLNDADALVGAHDKLRTAKELRKAHVPHPATVFLRPGATSVPLTPPLAIKPRHGSWGKDVFRCDTEEQVAEVLQQIHERMWFRRLGAIAQELVAPRGVDLRVLVARGRMVGAVERVAAAGEWRTNCSLGGTKRGVDPPPQAVDLAVAAAAAIGADFVGVDLLPSEAGYVVLELNGAVEFDDTYSLAGRDVYLDLARALRLLREELYAESAVSSSSPAASA